MLYTFYMTCNSICLYFYLSDVTSIYENSFSVFYRNFSRTFLYLTYV